MKNITFSKIFNIYPDTDSKMQAVATFDEKYDLIRVRLLNKVPRGFYYSFLNDAMLEAENVQVDSQPEKLAALIK